MKKIFISLMLMITILLSACGKKEPENRIYVFSQPGCQHCEHAKEYFNRYYKNYDIKEMNIHEGNNMGDLLHYARKYNIPQQDLGTPLIVMGNNYVMGWGNEQMKQFNRYIKKFKPTQPDQNNS